MREILQILDVCLNRAAEGVRVLEDLTRYCLNADGPAAELKRLRHRIRKIEGIPYSGRLSARRSGEDMGPALSKMTALDGKNGLESLIRANAGRAQEALRSAEEMAKTVYPAAGWELEQCRFLLYDLEKSLQHIRKKGISLRPFLLGGLYGLTDSPSSLKQGRSNTEMARIMTGEGIGIIQYREKDLTLLEKYRECEAIRKITGKSGAVFIVNDHPDIAMGVEADGVHLGQDDLPVEEVRRLVGSGMLVGCSTHSPEQARRAVESGADYIGVGPLYATQTKRNVCAPVGLQYLDYVVENHTIPFVAIGGIKRYNLRDVTVRGASLIALVTEITGAENPAAVIREIDKILEKEFAHES